ncbi:MAG: ABC transporter substrate-binding protein [Deltaproteobacteria bacterium]|nr:ABC transporter substrate-binding protein [Deltaproteobacteria bacterium]
MKPPLLNGRAWFAAFVFLYCSLPFAAAEENETRLRLGGLLSLTGTDSRMGKAELEGATQAFADLRGDGPALEFVVEDTASSDEGLGGAMSRLRANKGIAAVVGPTSLERSIYHMGSVGIAELFFLSPSAHVGAFKREPYRYERVYSTAYPIQDQLHLIFKALENEDRKRVAIIGEGQPQDYFAQEARDAAPRAEMEVVSFLTLTEESDLERATLPLLDSNADVWIISVRSPKPLRHLVDRYSQLKQKPIVMFLDESASAVRGAGLAAKLPGRYCQASFSDREFVESRFASFDDVQRLRAVSAYDAVMILAEPLRRGHTDAQSIRRYLQGRMFLTRARGPVRFLTSGTIEPGKFRLIDLN